MEIGFAMCGSFCTFSEVFPIMEEVAKQHHVIPIFSFASASIDSRFGSAENHLLRAAEICGSKPLHSIEAVEPIGPKKLLDALRPQIHGMVHCSGGAQTKILHFVGDNIRVIKDNLFPVPPLFRTIHEQSGTDWAEMYKVFNMGHRLEVYLSPEHAEDVIAISKSFGIDAQVVGRVEECDHKELIIRSEFGEFIY